jgi:hypothetical protein
MIPYSARPWTAQREREQVLHVFLLCGDAKLNLGRL